MTSEASSPAPRLTGGCQCGAVRYAVTAEPEKPSICHCRMCQKAFGAYFAPLASVKKAAFEWTRGQPTRFRSSSLVSRGFCALCGTPLTYEFHGVPAPGSDAADAARHGEPPEAVASSPGFAAHDEVAFSLGSLDDPALVPPVIQYGIEARMPWLASLDRLPGSVTEDDMPEGAMDALVSYQHPDHDTADWPPASDAKAKT
ncbi:GFA family protein [Pseudoxanthobacter sp. M-2]|uniref:GFA family protein n=1 Tax=Pseudoxanthobacter sp. M-2 TaxID=3078754 RepID=UPI0038FD24E8